MATETAKAAVDTSKGAWVRRYPPLLTLIMALFVGAAILPSALNLPQANPSTVLEYAPVPPDENSVTSNEGSMSALGLGSSGGLTTGVREKAQEVAKTGGNKRLPPKKNCVEQIIDGKKELKQTNDPNAPPCVPFFDGFNGGATSQGVTEDEITVLVYTSASISVDTTRGENSGTSPSGGSYCDVDLPPNTDPGCLDGDTQTQDHFRVRVARIMSKYFNENFQTYNRHVHVHVFYANSSATASSRRADAADNWEKLKPFAVIDQAFFGGYNAVYAEAMVKRKVMVFGSFASLPNKYYADNAPMIWSYWPDVERAAELYKDYICKKVAPYPVSHAGPGIAHGQERRYGLMSTSDPGFPGMQYFAQLVEAGLQSCPNGAKVNVVEKVQFPRATYSKDTHPDAIKFARNNVAELKAARVTTVLWLNGMEGTTTYEAKSNEYYPEWIVAGDNFIETLDNGQDQQQDVWRYAWAVTNLIREGNYREVPARGAYRSVEPDGGLSDEDEAAGVYRDYFLLFKSIQIAGPRITPQAVDAGAHAIPRIRSTSPFIAACYYDPKDFSCVKDANELWWDSDAPDPTGQAGNSGDKGCWRMAKGGARFVAGTWPSEPADVFNRGAVQRGEAPCSILSAGTFINPYGPRG